MRVALLLMFAALPALPAANEVQVRALLARKTGTIRLPAGIIEISRELTIAEGAHDLIVEGAPDGTVLKASKTFQGRAVLACKGGFHLQFRNFTIDGNRSVLEKPTELLTEERPFAQLYGSNGILAEDVNQLHLSDMR